MEVNEITTQRWSAFLQSPKRLAFIFLAIIVVVSGLIIDQLLTTDVRINAIQSVSAADHEPVIVDQSNDTPLVSAPEIPAAVLPTWHTISIQKGTTLSSLLKTYPINKSDIAAITALPEVKTNLAHLKTGETLNILADGEHSLVELRYQISPAQTIDIKRTSPQHYSAQIIKQPITKYKVSAHGTVQGSLYQSVLHAGVPRKIAHELVTIFESNVNLAKDVHTGDKFNLVYEDEYVGNKKIGTANIAAATLELSGKTHSAIRFVDSHGHANYYTPDGKNLKSGFLRSPVHYRRIGSSFSPNRMHPLLHIKRPHYGVDLSAPSGTPIDAAGDGVVKFAGRGTGYGNLIIIDHGHGITTRYAHIHKFARGIRQGVRVSAGEIIAYVGSTGLATGPHLHYEFRINGVPHDPLRIKLPKGAPINPSYKREFTHLANRLLAELEASDGNAIAVNHITPNDDQV